MALLAVLGKNIKQIPDKIFQENGFKREDILFFATMSDGELETGARESIREDDVQANLLLMDEAKGRVYRNMYLALFL